MRILILDARAVQSLLVMPQVIEAVEAAFVAYGRGEAHMPPKVYLEVPNGDFRAMPAYVAGAAGVKWVNVHPQNPTRVGLPTVMALIIYSDPATGAPLAVLDGTLITRYRTGAAAAVATRRLARPDARTVGLIGCGGQAEAHLVALTDVMSPERIYLADRNRENAERLAARFPQLECRVVDIETACGADVLSTLTPSRVPFVRRAWLQPGCHVNAMGADAPGKEELEPEVLLGARIFVDDWEQASHSGEINVPYGQGVLKGVAGTLPDLLCGRIGGRTGPAEITIFDSTGLALQDVAVARLVYDEARRRDVGLEVDFSLGDEAGSRPLAQRTAPGA
ncbi:MAG: ornithine cyclodeaminase family protein [Chloroflexi bacterium]|nr:ornithine cyclodeaminase family protein [Chloroflexota bacterium]